MRSPKENKERSITSYKISLRSYSYFGGRKRKNEYLSQTQFTRIKDY